MALTADNVMSPRSKSRSPRRGSPLEEMLIKRRTKRYQSRHDQRDDVMKVICSKWGQASAVAEHLGIKPQAVSQWNRVPAQYVVDLAPLLGMKPEEIRPDIFKPRKK